MTEGERYSDELLDKYFEFFKHLTTLNVATALALLAIQEAFGSFLVVVPLVMLGISLGLALEGMYAVTLRLEKSANSRNDRSLRWTLWIAIALFGFGLGAFVVSAL
jgi:hypothetical protein